MDWQRFLIIATRHLAQSPRAAPCQPSWCAWTTFDRLGEDAGYWTAALPLEAELLSDGTADGGVWGQPFRYDQLAHLILPRRFHWDRIADGGFEAGIHEQDIDGLSARLRAEGVAHRLSMYVLEVKLY